MWVVSFVEGTFVVIKGKPKDPTVSQCPVVHYHSRCLKPKRFPGISKKQVASPVHFLVSSLTAPIRRMGKSQDIARPRAP